MNPFLEHPPSFDTDSPLKRLYDKMRRIAQEQLRNEAECMEREEAEAQEQGEDRHE